MNGIGLFRVRIALIQTFLQDNEFDGILLTRVDNFAMATGGKRNYVYVASDLGACSLFVTKEGAVYFVGNNIEETRVMAEELGGLGCEIRSFLWFEDSAAAVVQREFSGVLVSDDGSLGHNVNEMLSYVRALLTEGEMEKYRRLGRLAAEAMVVTLDSIEAGVSEAEIAAILIAEGAKRRCRVPVSLVAADERIARYRHPIPTQRGLLPDSNVENTVERYVMVVGCFLCEGLVVSMTRFKKVGDLPETTVDAYRRICGVDAIMQEASVPGKTLGDVFAACQQAYRAMGFPPHEWHNHHQGGTTGYAGRTCKASPGETFPILASGWAARVNEIAGIETSFAHAFAWNPSAVGVKSEDTFLLLNDGTREIVTATPELPVVDLASVLGRSTEVVKSDMAEH